MYNFGLAAIGAFATVVWMLSDISSDIKNLGDKTGHLEKSLKNLGDKIGHMEKNLGDTSDHMEKNLGDKIGHLSDKR